MLKHQVVWAKCAVTKPVTDEEVILVKGDLLPDWVSEFTKFVLTGCGAVKAVEELDPALTAVTPEPVYLQEHQLPPVVSATGLSGPAVTLAPAPPAPPAPNATKPEWVAYAVIQRAEGVSEDDARAEADKLTKAELIAKYGNGS